MTKLIFRVILKTANEDLSVFSPHVVTTSDTNTHATCKRNPDTDEQPKCTLYWGAPGMMSFYEASEKFNLSFLKILKSLLIWTNPSIFLLFNKQEARTFIYHLFLWLIHHLHWIALLLPLFLSLHRQQKQMPDKRGRISVAVGGVSLPERLCISSDCALMILRLLTYISRLAPTAAAACAAFLSAGRCSAVVTLRNGGGWQFTWIPAAGRVHFDL